MSSNLWNFNLTFCVWIVCTSMIHLTSGIEPCDPSSCVLPNCFCGNQVIPGGMNVSDIPQFILFSFDDAVTGEINTMYDQLFPPGRVNPNGCPITMTMFISNNFTDYNLVRELYRRGMEAAVHSVTHQVPTTYWKMASWESLKFEILEQRDIISTKAGIPESKILGWRSPFLQPSGDQQYSVLRQAGFEYDSTLTVTTDGNSSRKMWPLTLDNGWNLPCNVQPCPKGKYNGLWEMPIQMLEYEKSTGCLYVDSCRPSTVDESYKLFWDNFHSHYTTTRSPIFYTMHPAWLREEHNFQAMDWFILTMLHYYPDVYFVTYQQLLKWMRNPVPVSELKNSSPWGACDWNVNRGDGRFVNMLQGAGNTSTVISKNILLLFISIFMSVLFTKLPN